MKWVFAKFVLLVSCSLRAPATVARVVERPVSESACQTVSLPSVRYALGENGREKNLIVENRG